MANFDVINWNLYLFFAFLDSLRQFKTIYVITYTFTSRSAFYSYLEKNKAIKTYDTVLMYIY